MGEFHKPGPDVGTFRNSRDIARAVAEMTEIAGTRADAHREVNLFRDLHVRPSDNREHRLRRELDRAKGVLGRWSVMSAHGAFKTVDLARVEHTNWTATDAVESEVSDLADRLEAEGVSSGQVDSLSPDAKLRMIVDPTLVSARGLVAVRRKRLVLVTKPVEYRFTDTRPADWRPGAAPVAAGPLVADTHIELDRVSEFIVDIERMRLQSPGAAFELNAIGSVGVPTDITQWQGRLQSPSAIEQAIADREESIAPVITTYYAHRQYANIRPDGATSTPELIGA